MSAYASGKVILFGEHSVVYGKPAIAFPLDRGICIEINQVQEQEAFSQGPYFEMNGELDGETLVVSADDNSCGPKVLIQAMQKLREIFGDRLSTVSFSAQSSIPLGCGLGSSAALSVALIRCVSNYLNKELSFNETLNLAQQLESVFHGNPSGIDHSVIAAGRCIYFEKKKHTKLEYIKLKEQLEMLIVIPGKHVGTAKSVSEVALKYQNSFNEYTSIFEGIADVVKDGRAALENGHLEDLGALMNKNQGYLKALGVSSDTTEKIIDRVLAAGALGAKLTGAGGGGAVIVLCNGNADKVMASLAAFKYHCFLSHLI